MKPLSPYSHAHTVEDPKIREELIQQFKERGFDDTELWSLWETICKFIYPRLTRFKEIHETRFPNNSDYIECLNEMIKTFNYTIFLAINVEASKDRTKGLNLFAEHFFSLWF